MKIFLAISAILAWLFGLMLLIIPGQFYAPTGIVMSTMMATVAQAHGATLVGVGFMNWFVRGAGRKAATAVLIGNLAIQIISLVVVVLTIVYGAGFAVAPAVVIHVTLGVVNATFLIRIKKLADSSFS